MVHYTRQVSDSNETLLSHPITLSGITTTNVNTILEWETGHIITNLGEVIYDVNTGALTAGDLITGFTSTPVTGMTKLGNKLVYTSPGIHGDNTVYLADYDPSSHTVSNTVNPVAYNEDFEEINLGGDAVAGIGEDLIVIAERAVGPGALNDHLHVYQYYPDVNRFYEVSSESDFRDRVTGMTHYHGNLFIAEGSTLYITDTDFNQQETIGSIPTTHGITVVNGNRLLLVSTSHVLDYSIYSGYISDGLARSIPIVRQLPEPMQLVDGLNDHIRRAIAASLAIADSTNDHLRRAISTTMLIGDGLRRAFHRNVHDHGSFHVTNPRILGGNTTDIVATQVLVDWGDHMLGSTGSGFRVFEYDPIAGTLNVTPIVVGSGITVGRGAARIGNRLFWMSGYTIQSGQYDPVARTLTDVTTHLTGLGSNVGGMTSWNDERILTSSYQINPPTIIRSYSYDAAQNTLSYLGFSTVPLPISTQAMAAYQNIILLPRRDGHADVEHGTVFVYDYNPDNNSLTNFRQFHEIFDYSPNAATIRGDKLVTHSSNDYPAVDFDLRHSIESSDSVAFNREVNVILSVIAALSDAVSRRLVAIRSTASSIAASDLIHTAWTRAAATAIGISDSIASKKSFGAVIGMTVGLADSVARRISLTRRMSHAFPAISESIIRTKAALIEAFFAHEEVADSVTRDRGRSRSLAVTASLSDGLTSRATYYITEATLGIGDSITRAMQILNRIIGDGLGLSDIIRRFRLIRENRTNVAFPQIEAQKIIFKQADLQKIRMWAR